MASSAAPRKRRLSHAVAARSSVTKRAAAQLVAVYSNDDDDEEEMENERLRLEASDCDDMSADGDENLTLGLASAARCRTAEEALQQAKAEGFSLQPADNAAGFKGVRFDRRTITRPYHAHVRRGGKNVHLGVVTTAEEAALCYARETAANGAPLLSSVAKSAAAPAPLTAEEATCQAEAEGLTLQTSDNSAGFKGVNFKSGKSKPYRAQVRRGGKMVTLQGWFVTAEEAALCDARDIAANVAVGVAETAAAPGLTAEEALRQAEVEGLTLQPSNNVVGFKGVSFNSGRPKPYKAEVRRGSKRVHLGCFATAEEAALCYTRDIAANGAPALTGVYAAAAAAPAPLTAEEVLRQAEAEGLALQPSDHTTGFKGVYFDSGRSKPYKAKVGRDGKTVSLGRFATAEEAALCYTRDITAHGAPGPCSRRPGWRAAAPAPLTAEEAMRPAKTKGIVLQRSDKKAGFKGVSGDSRGKSRPYTVTVTRRGNHLHGMPSEPTGDGFVGRDEAAEDNEEPAEAADEEAASVMVLVGEAVEARTSDDDCMVVDAVRATNWLEPIATLSNEDDEPLCPICFEAFTDTAWGRTPCGHAFHKACLREWTQAYANTHCPECRSGLSRSWRRTFTPEEGAQLV